MKTSHQVLRNTIEDLIYNKEKELQHKLHFVEVGFLIDTYSDFVVDIIHKFVSGSKEHESDNPDEHFLNSVDHKKEIYNEVLDLLNYTKALTYKERLKR